MPCSLCPIYRTCRNVNQMFLNTYYWIRRQLTKIADIPSEIKWFWQRGRRGYSDRDVWGFDHYLTQVIIGGTAQLAENAHGCPPELFECKYSNEEQPDCSTCTGGESNSCPACHKWQTVLMDISNGFANYKRLVLDDELMDKVMEGRTLSYIEGKGYTLDPEITEQEWNDHRINVENVDHHFKTVIFPLLIKYYNNLWD